jgi:hypothetical protein
VGYGKKEKKKKRTRNILLLAAAEAPSPAHFTKVARAAGGGQIFY